MQSSRDVLATFAKLNWKTDLDEEGNGSAYAIVGGNRETGELFVFAILQNAAAPAHRHGDGEDYGEKIGTFFGELEDETDDGRPVRIGPDDVLYHAPGSIHQPRAEFWFGYYH
ncbi:MAG: hypothetical protein KC729_09780, partial [Candidatus Eisenbacteria bacterium]|nr:hypothetical protein [Candidatus Eisenbacteria bacterium]